MTQTMDGFNEAGTFETNWHTLKKALFYIGYFLRMQNINEMKNGSRWSRYFVMYTRYLKSRLSKFVRVTRFKRKVLRFPM